MFLETITKGRLRAASLWDGGIMIKYRYNRVVHAPRDFVFITMRDKQTELNEMLPNVSTCSIVEDRPCEGSRRIVAEVAGKSDIPFFLKPFLNPRQLVWHSIQTWDEDEWSCDYRIETAYFRDNVEVRGKWWFKERTSDKTNIYIDSMIGIDAGGIPGVPDQLARGISTLAEQILHKMTLPNLNRICAIVEEMNGCH